MLRRMLQSMMLLVVGTPFVLQGCAALVGAGAGAAAGVGAASYVGGEMKTTYAAPLHRTWDATLGALREANLRVTATEKDSIKGKIKAERGDGTSVTLALEEAGPGTTTVGVRVGTFGDEEASRAIHNRIAARLGARAG